MNKTHAELNLNIEYQYSYTLESHYYSTPLNSNLISEVFVCCEYLVTSQTLLGDRWRKKMVCKQYYLRFYCFVPGHTCNHHLCRIHFFYHLISLSFLFVLSDSSWVSCLTLFVHGFTIAIASSPPHTIARRHETLGDGRFTRYGSKKSEIFSSLLILTTVLSLSFSQDSRIKRIFKMSWRF